MNSLSFYNKFIVRTAILTIPILSFINTNFYILDFVVFKTILFILLASIILTSLLAKLLSRIFKKLNYIQFHFILTVLYFLLFFFYGFLRELINTVTSYYHNYIAFFLIILLFIFFYIFFFSKKNHIIIRFTLVYLCLCFIFNLGSFLLNSPNFFSKKISTPTLLFKKEEFQNMKKNMKKNIYYIIVDSALPLEKFDKMYQTNHYNDYNSKFNELGYSLVNNTKSSYTATRWTLASIFNLSYYININNYKSIPISFVYPGILTKAKAQDLPLIKTLDKMGYEVYGVDISSKLIDIAKKTHPNINAKVGDAENLEFADIFFDIVF